MWLNIYLFGIKEIVIPHERSWTASTGEEVEISGNGKGKFCSTNVLSAWIS